MPSPLQFRNVSRYVRDVDANVPLYEAIGFRKERAMGDMVVLRNEEGLSLILHRLDGEGAADRGTALGFTVTGTLDEARRHIEAAGFRCLREPAPEDRAVFFIYGDLDGNPVNLVLPPKPPAAGSGRPGHGGA